MVAGARYRFAICRIPQGVGSRAKAPCGTAGGPRWRVAKAVIMKNQVFFNPPVHKLMRPFSRLGLSGWVLRTWESDDAVVA